jgi:arylsulfatase A-like enzyme
MSNLRRFAVALAVFALAAPAPAAPPNVIVILADDQGWGDLSGNGNGDLCSPHLDSLATDGAKCDRFFVQPVCSPTRAEFLTGRWHPRCGVRDVSTGGERLDLDERTIADAFRAAGYATACFGKWHNGTQYPYHPTGRGFDEYYGFTSGHWGTYFDPPLDHNGKDVTGTGYLADDLADRAGRFLATTAAAGKPFLCFLAFNTPHSPMQVPDADWKRFADKPLAFTVPGLNVPHTRAALAMCENLDANVGRVLAAVKKAGADDNTIVVYFSDNGPNGRRWNGGMKGIKGSTDEGGVRSPLHVRWPARIKPGTVVAPVAAAVDLYPTLADLAGVKRAGDKPFDGISLAPWLTGKADPAPDRVLFQHWAGKVSARTQRFRLDAAGQLFDLPADPGQAKNVAADQPAEAARLAAAVDEWRKTVLAELPKADDRPIPAGHAAFPRCVLPARDGSPHGGVKRSAAAPNCSFFTNWTKADDRITWPVETAAAGTYEAVLHYTCPKADVGTRVRLTFGDAAWAGTVADAFDPPLRGADEDRVKRSGESYVKDFRTLSLGRTRLPAGRGTLALSAPDGPAGKTVADVRAVELILIPEQK